MLQVECSATATAPTATDNCEGSITGTTTDPVEYTEQGTYTIHWTYDDGNGNTSTQNQTVIVDDVTAPVADVETLSNVTGECTATATAPTATDNCEGSITGTTTDARLNILNRELIQFTGLMTMVTETLQLKTKQ